MKKIAGTWSGLLEILYIFYRYLGFVFICQFEIQASYYMTVKIPSLKF